MDKTLIENYHPFAKYDEGEIWESNTENDFPSFMDKESIEELTGIMTSPERSYIWVENDLLE